MLSLFARSELYDLFQKVENGERLGYNEGVRLMQSKDILALGYLANTVRERKNADRTYFFVDPDERSFNLRLQTLQDTAYALLKVHTLSAKQNTDQAAPASEKSLTVETTEAACFYGNDTTAEERVHILLKVREFQDQTGKLLAFAPLSFYSGNIKSVGNMGIQKITGFEDLRMLSVSRILLDNVDHIKGFWQLLGPKLAQVSLNFGVDDLDGFISEGLASEKEVSPELRMLKRPLVKMIHRAGRRALERDALYRVLEDYGKKGENSKDVTEWSTGSPES